MKVKLLIIFILLFGLFSCGIGKNIGEENKTSDLSKYYSESCPKGEIMSSRNKYPDGNIEVKHCIKPYICTEGKKLKGSCGDLITYMSCKLECLGKGELP